MSRRSIFRFVAVVVLAGVAWLLRSGEVGPRAVASAQPSSFVVAQPQLESSDDVREPPLDVATPEAAPSEAETSTAPIDNAAIVEKRPPSVGFDGVFTSPGGSLVSLENAQVVFRGDRAPSRVIAIERGVQLLVLDLEPDLYTVDVNADGVVHRTQRFDLSDPASAPTTRGTRVTPLFSGRVVPTFSEPLYVWPAEWVAVVAHTRDGRAFTAIADKLTMEPRRLFVGAFDVRVRLTAPGLDAQAQGESGVAVFRPPPRYQSWELPGSAVGSLELLQEPPMWIGLDVFGLPLGWKRLAPGAHEVGFVLDASDLEPRFATLALHVTNAAGAPATDARVTLRADTSAHRREDQGDVAPDSDGRVEFTRIVPGRYEFVIECAGSLYQDRLVLAASEHRDLGTIKLSTGAGIDVQVIDAAGQPVRAWIEIGPYSHGARTEDLYPPNLNRTTDGAGRYRLPLPTTTSIVRATPLEVGSYRSDFHRRSTSALVDPAAPPRSPLTLVVALAVTLELDIRMPGEIAVVDELGLVAYSISLHGSQLVRTALPPGLYLVRRAATASELVFETSVEIVHDVLRVEVR